MIERLIVLTLLGLFLARFADAPALHLHDWLLIAAELLVGFFVLVRRAGAPVDSFPAWAAALVGTGAPMLVAPTGMLNLTALGSVLMMAGFFTDLSAKLFLRRSFGLVAANRGVKTDGPYRLVRHPMYAGYLLTHIGFLLAAFSIWNVTVYAVCWAAMIFRIAAEETLLLRDADYAAYAQKVRSRLIPGIW